MIIFATINVLLVLASKCFSHELPNYFPRCKLDDPNLNGCLTKAANELRPYIRNGIEEINFPSFDPLFITTWKINQNTDLVKYTLAAWNQTTKGLDKYNLTEVRFDPKTMTFDGKIEVESITMFAICKMQGNILSVAIEGNGTILAISDSIHGTYEVTGKLVKRKGIEYYKPISTKVNMVIEDGKYELHGFFADNQELERVSNEILNQNSKILTDALTPALENLAGTGLIYLMKSLTQKVPYGKLFDTNGGITPYKYWKNNGIKHVNPLPFIGNMFSTITRTQGFPEVLQSVYNSFPEERYVGFYQFISPTLMIRDPRLIKNLLVKEFDVFPEHRTFIPRGIDPLWDKTVFAMKGEDNWHGMRSTLSPAFTSSKMKTMFVLMKDCAKQFTNYFLNQDTNLPVEMKNSFTRFTNDVIATTAFGIACDSLKNQDNEFYLMGKNISDFSGIRGLKFFLGGIGSIVLKLLDIGVFYKKSCAFFRKIFKETLEVREKNGIVLPDMVHLLMEAKKGRLRDDDSSEAVWTMDLLLLKNRIMENCLNHKNPKSQTKISQPKHFF